MDYDEQMDSTCPRCGSASVRWRLKRRVADALTDRVLVWSCAECGDTWVESVFPEVRDRQVEPRLQQHESRRREGGRNSPGLS